MNYESALEYIHAVQWAGHKPGLSRTRTLLAALGDPHKKLRFVHVAGTNGKGSTAAMLASCLQAAGYRVGLYTSPFINRFNERIQVNGEQIPDDALVRLAQAIAHACQVEPLLNSWFDGRTLSLRQHAQLDLGIAVDTPDGLFVPVLRDVGRRSAAEALRLEVAQHPVDVGAGDPRVPDPQGRRAECPRGIGEFLSELLEFHFPFLGGCGVAGEARCRQGGRQQAFDCGGFGFHGRSGLCLLYKGKGYALRAVTNPDKRLFISDKACGGWRDRKSVV